MALAEIQLLDTQRAFDGVARTYDQSNVANPILEGMRQRTLATVCATISPGSRVLDLGCGPGTDAIRLARLGYRVTAIDWSPAMVAQARTQVENAGCGGLVDVRHLGVQSLEALSGMEFDGAYSNFGPLNCAPDLSAAATGLAPLVRPGGVVVASVIGRICPWEIARYGFAGRWRRMSIRFRRGFVAVPLEGGTIWTHYYTPREFFAPFAAAGFTHSSTRALGLFAPPPYLHAFAERHATLIRTLERIDNVVGAWPLCRAMGDHFLMVARRGERP